MTHSQAWIPRPATQGPVRRTACGVTGAAGHGAPVRSWCSSVTDIRCRHLARLERAPFARVWMATSDLAPLATAQRTAVHLPLSSSLVVPPVLGSVPHI